MTLYQNGMQHVQSQDRHNRWRAVGAALLLLGLSACGSDETEVAITAVTYQDGSPVTDYVNVTLDGTQKTCDPDQLEACVFPLGDLRTSPERLPIQAEVGPGIELYSPVGGSVEVFDGTRNEVALSFIRPYTFSVFVEAGLGEGVVPNVEVVADGQPMGRTNEYGVLDWEVDTYGTLSVGQRINVTLNPTDPDEPPLTHTFTIEPGRFDYAETFYLGEAPPVAETDRTPPVQPRRDPPPARPDPPPMARLSLQSDPPGVTVRLTDQRLGRAFTLESNNTRSLPPGQYAYEVVETPEGYAAAEPSGTMTLGEQGEQLTITLAAAAPPATASSVRFETEPSGATIRLQGQDNGQTYTVRSGQTLEVEPGLYTWEITETPPGYSPQRSQVALDLTGGGTATETIALTPVNSRESYQNGLEAERTGEYRAAVQYFGEVTPAGDSDLYFEAQNRMGTIYMEHLNSPGNAVRAFSNAVQAKPRAPRTHFNLALAYYQTQESRQARTHLREATQYISLEPTATRKLMRMRILHLQALCDYLDYQQEQDARRREQRSLTASSTLEDFLIQAGSDEEVSRELLNEILDAQEKYESLTGSSN